MEESETADDVVADDEPWNQVVLEEGYDVYAYDAERARRAHRLIIAIFFIAVSLTLYAYFRPIIDPLVVRLIRW